MAGLSMAGLSCGRLPELSMRPPPARAGGGRIDSSGSRPHDSPAIDSPAIEAPDAYYTAIEPPAQLRRRALRWHDGPSVAGRTPGAVRRPGGGRRSPPAAPGDWAARFWPNIGGNGCPEPDPGSCHCGRRTCGAATGCGSRQLLELLRDHRLGGLGVPVRMGPAATPTEMGRPGRVVITGIS